MRGHREGVIPPRCLHARYMKFSIYQSINQSINRLIFHHRQHHQHHYHVALQTVVGLLGLIKSFQVGLHEDRQYKLKTEYRKSFLNNSVMVTVGHRILWKAIPCVNRTEAQSVKIKPHLSITIQLQLQYKFVQRGSTVLCGALLHSLQ